MVTNITVEGDILTFYSDNNNYPTAVYRCSSNKEAEERSRVVNEAHSWLLTPYHHMGRIKGAGVDCATLLAEVYENCNVVNHVNIDFYPMDWNLHRGTERYLSYLLQYMDEITEEQAKPGDVVMYRWGRTMAHGAIIIGPYFPFIIHAERTIGKVTMSEGDMGAFSEREKRFYSPWNRKAK